MLVPDTSASSVRAQYRYATLLDARYNLNAGTRRFGKVRYDLDTRTAHLGNFGMPTKTPSVRAYPTERTLGEVSADYQPFRGSWEKSFESTAVGLLVMLAPQCQPTPSPTKQHTAWYYVSAIPFTAVALFNAVITAFH